MDVMDLSGDSASHDVIITGLSGAHRREVQEIRTYCDYISRAFKFLGDRYATLAYWGQVLTQNRKREGMAPFIFTDQEQPLSTEVGPTGQGSRMAAPLEPDPLLAKFESD